MSEKLRKRIARGLGEAEEAGENEVVDALEKEDEDDITLEENDLEPERPKKRKKKNKLAKKIDLKALAEEEADSEKRKDRSGVVYFSSIPPLFTASRMREELGRLAEVGRIYLQAEKRRNKQGNRRKRYVEGWVEFKKKSLAKRVALSIDNTPVGARKRSAAADTLWNCKYLSGFKWIHLVEQLSYEKKLEGQRMRAEIKQAKKVADHFEEQIDKGKNLKKLEEKVLKKGGTWEKYQRELQQRKTISRKKAAEREKKANAAGTTDSDLIQMIFAKD